jgi:hypothetical protein
MVRASCGGPADYASRACPPCHTKTNKSGVLPVMDYRILWRSTAAFVCVFLFCSCQRFTTQREADPKSLSAHHVAVLNDLRNEINLAYGYENGWPRVNRGPCGRFAKLFHEHWNTRFNRKSNIAFVMMPNASDGVGCTHVVVRLPDGNYFDGGSGVVPGHTLLKQFEQFGTGHRIEEMIEFDYELLNKRSYGLDRFYGSCTNYSDATTARIIEKHLARLPND